MAEQITKFSPHRDLQAYFLTPSAIAAMSYATSDGYVLSGSWRQQFDWAVVEWNRDNVFEHPTLRNLPDGDLRGLTLTYEEERTGCIPFQSNLFPVVSWDKLRLWVADASGSETVYYVNLLAHAVPIVGSTQSASATMSVIASPGVGKRAGLAFLEEHYYYQVLGSDQLLDIAAGIAASINAFSSNFTASSTGASVTVTWKSSSTQYSLGGSNGNRMTMYGFSEDSVPVWQDPAVAFLGGLFASKYRVTLDFDNLMGTTDNNTTTPVQVVTQNIRKVRWTWAADLQPGEFGQTEFQVTVSNWSVTGTNQLYSFAGPGSRRIEDTDPAITYTGSWDVETGNYSGSKIHATGQNGASCTIAYTESTSHDVYLGLRRTTGAPLINIMVDGGPVQPTILTLAGEDVLIRYPLGTLTGGPHSITVTHAGQDQTLFFDFVDIAHPANTLPDFVPNYQLALATDWDTYHAQSLAAERTAWLINKLGFTGRLNHYVGALWFYEIFRPGTQYASLTVEFQLVAGRSPYVQFALAGNAASLGPAGPRTLVSHLVLPDDDSATVALAVAALINVGTNLVWASTNGDRLTVTARSMGEDGNGIGFALAATSTADFTVVASSNVLSGGIDGRPYDLVADNNGVNDTLRVATEFWRTDLTAMPRMNRAARDWHAAFFAAVRGYGMDCVCAFSTELKNGDPSAEAGIAQRYFDGGAMVVSTPAIQTNFSPTSLAYWTQVYLDMAAMQSAAGFMPYLQSGEVQWWYYPIAPGTSMPFYDSYTQEQFTAQYGTAMRRIPDQNADPTLFPQEVALLPALIGAYTRTIRTALQEAFPGCRYEVLYPTDVNDTPLNLLVNYSAADWTPAHLSCLKTESFQFTGGYNLVKCTMSMSRSAEKGFPNSQRSHLVGVGDAWSAWLKEVDIAQSQGLESIVLFALDQYCLVGYPPPPFVNSTNSSRQGSS